MILSLTRAAALTIAGRDTHVAEELVGTLHSQCMRLLDSPTLVQAKHLKDWNEKYPFWRISPSTIGTSSQRVDFDMGSTIFEEIDLLRNRMTPFDEWQPTQREFFTTWTEWKLENGLIDFTDMLESVLNGKLKTSKSIAVLIGDEVQDFSRLELEVVLFWSRYVETLILVGDPHQSLYAFRGASKRALTGELFPEHGKRILSQSYRVPRAVHEVGERIMSQMMEIKPVEFKPTEVEGSVVRRLEGYKDLYNYMEYIKEAISQDEVVMILASCGYMLEDIISGLRQDGIPFWNPYAKKEGRWNPLTPKLERDAVSTAQRYIAFLEKPWTAKKVRISMELFSNIFKRGGRKAIRSLEDNDKARLAERVLLESVHDEFHEGMQSRDTKWAQQYCQPKYYYKLEYMNRIVDRFGVVGLLKPPKVIVSTIHSVKGGEAERVILFPDLSKSWNEAYQEGGWEGRDSVLRMFYVGVTRAKRELVLGGPTGRRYVEGF
jgi:superfamily I DNA/RNA helicase